MKSSSSNTVVDPELFRRFTPGGTLPRIPNADFLSIKEIREMFNIPKSVKISKMEKLTDPVGEDEVVVNLYQLACAFPMPIDSFTCALLTAWGITIPQVHPSLCLALRRIVTISNTYLRFIRPEDVQRIISLGGRLGQGRTWKVFSCEFRNRNTEFRLDGFPKSYKDWDKQLYRFRKWRKEHQDSIPTIPADEHDEHESDNRMQHFFNLPRSLFDVSLYEIYVECSYDRDLNANEVSLPAHASPLARRPGITIIDSDSENDECNPPKAKNLSDSQRPLASSRHCAKRSLVNGVFNSKNVPDAMSRKVCTPLRRSNRANNKVRYTYSDPTFDDSASDFVVHLRKKNCESVSPVSSEDESVENFYADEPPSMVPILTNNRPSSKDKLVGDSGLSKSVTNASLSPATGMSFLRKASDFDPVPCSKRKICPDVAEVLLTSSGHGLKGSASGKEIVELRTKVDELTIINKNQKEQIACCRDDLDATSLERTESRKRIYELESLLHTRTDELSQTREELQISKSRALNLYQFKNAFNAAFNDNGFDPTQ
ncbi:hypothetical protein MKW94_020044 [Papaver nudicaule]|uniref:Uncharacterized protein n=1 Tax=Papaver nudicaule TaxID=74823 RepID=A0AA41W2F1_PAPNU|nr:hypothetical protein [Papaver nudicaule]